MPLKSELLSKSIDKCKLSLKINFFPVQIAKRSEEQQRDRDKRFGPANSSPASRTGGGCGVGVGDRRNADGSMRRTQHDHSASVREFKEPAQQQQQHHYHHRTTIPSTPAATEQHTGRRMSLETLLQAAYYVEQEEKKRLASTSSSSSTDLHSFASTPPHSNHTYASTEPRGEYHALHGDLSRRVVVIRRDVQRRCIAL